MYGNLWRKMRPIKSYFLQRQHIIVSNFLVFANFWNVGKFAASIKRLKAKSV